MNNNNGWPVVVGMALLLLAALFWLGMEGEPLALITLGVIGTLAIAAAVVVMVIAVDRNKQRQFRENADENLALLNNQAKGLSELALAQQRQMRALGAGPVIDMGAAAGQPYQFDMAPDAFAGFDDAPPGFLES